MCARRKGTTLSGHDTGVRYVCASKVQACSYRPVFPCAPPCRDKLSPAPLHSSIRILYNSLEFSHLDVVLDVSSRSTPSRSVLHGRRGLSRYGDETCSKSARPDRQLGGYTNTGDAALGSKTSARMSSASTRSLRFASVVPATAQERLIWAWIGSSRNSGESCPMCSGQRAAFATGSDGKRHSSSVKRLHESRNHHPRRRSPVFLDAGGADLNASRERYVVGEAVRVRREVDHLAWRAEQP